MIQTPFDRITKVKLCTEEARDDWVLALEAARDAAIQEKNAQEESTVKSISLD